MKSTIQRALFAVAMAALGAGAIGIAAAQTPSSAPAPTQGAHHRHHRFGGGSPFLGTFLRAVHQLNKTPATALNSGQQATLKTLLQSARQSHSQGQGQGLNLSVIGDPNNSTAYSNAVQQAQANATARIARESNLASQIYSQLSLSTAQVTQLQVILNNMQAQQQARRAQWAAKYPGNS